MDLGEMPMRIGFLKDLSDVTCWKALGTQGRFERPRARGGHKPKSGMSRRVRCTRLLLQITGFQRVEFTVQYFFHCW